MFGIHIDLLFVNVQNHQLMHYVEQKASWGYLAAYFGKDEQTCRNHWFQLATAQKAAAQKAAILCAMSAATAQKPVAAAQPPVASAAGTQTPTQAASAGPQWSTEVVSFLDTHELLQNAISPLRILFLFSYSVC